MASVSPVNKQISANKVTNSTPITSSAAKQNTYIPSATISNTPLKSQYYNATNTLKKPAGLQYSPVSFSPEKTYTPLNQSITRSIVTPVHIPITPVALVPFPSPSAAVAHINPLEFEGLKARLSDIEAQHNFLQQENIRIRGEKLFWQDKSDQLII